MSCFFFFRNWGEGLPPSSPASQSASCVGAGGPACSAADGQHPCVATPSPFEAVYSRLSSCKCKRRPRDRSSPCRQILSPCVAEPKCPPHLLAGCTFWASSAASRCARRPTRSRWAARLPLLAFNGRLLQSLALQLLPLCADASGCRSRPLYKTFALGPAAAGPQHQRAPGRVPRPLHPPGGPQAGGLSARPCITVFFHACFQLQLRPNALCWMPWTAMPATALCDASSQRSTLHSPLLCASLAVCVGECASAGYLPPLSHACRPPLLPTAPAGRHVVVSGLAADGGCARQSVKEAHIKLWPTGAWRHRVPPSNLRT